ncbi:MAG: thioredoxin family protein [Saprospiraceae bacterium]|nr:thioredoxin family protein [Saprospiraceae bacterium]
MKYILLFLFTLSLGSIHAQGIAFESSDFQSALTKAKAEKKLIFMDAYTTWCGPCKWMSKNVFTDANVGAYFNENFINVKIDMEKGEGIDLAKKYEVSAYPTLLFIDGNGDLKHMSIGSRPADDFVDLGHAANDPERQLMTMKNRFESGERSGAFLKKYTDVLTSAGMKNFDEVAEMYMDTQKDWSTAENMQFIFDYSEASMESKLFTYSMDKKEAFKALVGEEKFDQKLSYAAEFDRGKAGIARDDVENLELHYKKYFDADRARNVAMVTYMKQLMYSPDPVEQEKFKAEIQLFLANTPDVGSNFYNSVAWQIYEISTDRSLLKKAADWAQISIDQDKNSFNTDTMAALQYKLGNKDQAELFATESIQLAKKEGNDFSSTEELLKKILAN